MLFPDRPGRRPTDRYRRYSSPAVTLVHAFISKEAGLFQKHGLDARIVVFEGGSLLAQAALAGEVKISMNSGSVTIASRSQGADSTIVGAYVNTLPYSVVAAKGLTKWEQLKGKRIAISRLISHRYRRATGSCTIRFGRGQGRDPRSSRIAADPFSSPCRRLHRSDHHFATFRRHGTKTGLSDPREHSGTWNPLSPGNH
jgi:hypothetical protein